MAASRKKQNEILETIVCFWSPAGVSREQAVRNCESLVPEIYRRLLAAMNREELARYLYDHEPIKNDSDRRDSLRWTAAENVAEKLLQLDLSLEA